jgi:hypothetical protein
MSKLLDELISEFESREQRGFQKYGTTMDRQDLSLQEWMQHFKEELMDGLLYLHKLQTLINDTQGLPDYQKEDSRNDECTNPDGEVEPPRASL